MNNPFSEPAHVLYSKRLDFWLGASERDEGVYTEYMTDGEQACNTAKNSSVKSIFITCEHGGNDIPDAYQYLFRNAVTELATHRGYDIGALSVFQLLKEAKIADFYHHTTISRLFIELNRSIGHPRLWSTWTHSLPFEEKQKILHEYYFSYRDFVENNITQAINQGKRVIHIAVHSFTPELNGEIRRAEVGLLYDSRRLLEKNLCQRWQHEIQQLAPDWRVRANYPYRGSSDGFATYLRKRFSAESYLGIELEINQAKLLRDSEQIKQIIKSSIEHICQQTL